MVLGETEPGRPLPKEVAERPSLRLPEIGLVAQLVRARA